MADISGAGSDDDQPSDASTANVRPGGSAAAAPSRPELALSPSASGAPLGASVLWIFRRPVATETRPPLFGARRPAIGVSKASTVDAVRDRPVRPSAFGPLIEEARNFAMTLFGIRGYCDARRKRGESQKCRAMKHGRLSPCLPRCHPNSSIPSGTLIAMSVSGSLRYAGTTGPCACAMRASPADRD